MHFSGTTIDPAIDNHRLSTALDRVYRLMQDGQWRTLKQIAESVGTSEAGASARLRDFRKSRFKELYPVEAMNSRRVSGGLWEYQLVVATKQPPNGMLFE